MSKQGGTVSSDEPESTSGSGITADPIAAKIKQIQQLIKQTPSGHLDLPKHFQALGNAYAERYRKAADLRDIQMAILYHQRAVTITPTDLPTRADPLEDLGWAFGARYQRLKNLEDLEAAMLNNLEAVKFTPANDPDRPRRLHTLALSFRDQYRRLGAVKDLEAAVKNDIEAVNLTAMRNPNRPRLLEGLSASYSLRYQRLGTLKDLESALQNMQEAVELTPTSHPHKAHRLRSLGICLKDRFRRLGYLQDIEDAVQKGLEAVDLTPVDHHERPRYLQSLGDSFTARYERLGSLTDLDAVVQSNQEAINLVPAGRPDRPKYLVDLGASLTHRYQQSKDLKDLETAIKIKQEAVDLTPVGHPDRARYLQSLSVSFMIQYRGFGNLMDLEAAVQNNLEAVKATPANHPARARCLQTLAGCLRTRYQRFGDLKDLEAALQRVQQAVKLTPASHPDKPEYLHSLALSLQDRYERVGNLTDLESAVQTHQETATLTPEDDPNRPQRLQHHAVALLDRYKQSKDLKDLEAVMKNFQQAVDLTREDHPDRAELLQRLAVAFRARYMRLGDLKDLETGIQKSLQALNLTPSGNPNRLTHLQGLAASYFYRYQRLKDKSDLEHVHNYYSACFAASAWNDPESCWKTALEWSSFSEQFRPSMVPTAYSTAFRFLPEILWMGNAISVRHDAILRLDIGRITSTATRSCIRLGQLKSAVEILEQGLGTTFQQMLQLKPDVDKLSPQQAADLQRLSSELYSGAAANPKEVATKRQDLLDNIRKQPGLEHFLLPNPYASLCQTAQRGPVVILNSHVNGCDGIIIISTTPEPIHVSLASIKIKDLESQRKMLKELLGRCNVRNRDRTDAIRLFGQQEGVKSGTTKECFEELLTWLWENVVNPVYEVLTSHNICSGRLWWLPTGEFTGLPLHASPPTDQFIHSYTATLGSLLDTQHKKSSSTPSKLGVVGVEITMNGVKQEVQKICSIVKNGLQCLEGENATTDAVKLQLQDCPWIHLACHGTQNLVKPTKSCLSLYGGSLELETILQMSLSNAQFVFLAACQTAMGDAELVNESFHLGGGFIAAGFRSAVGTLWSMNDQDGPLVAEIFYAYLFRDGRQPKVDETAKALQMAVQELRARNVPYERWIPFIHMGV
ncbi:CHAT domain-containing protein [Mycena maculata]|uniref:CHAT domain-containing protein n=1 Tax=Mycena maculata TaxID=230809 RepID=A0AAD7JJZ8_9AGAR|nr:CHAT domain-containing protein [Mycena maculata]